MSKEKQIEEMANAINEMDEPNAHYYGRNMKMHEAFADCFTIAKHLYSAGYRKQSDVVREIFEEIESAKVSIGDFKIKTFKVISFGEATERTITGDVVAFSDIAELKKKYIEVKNDN